MMRILLVEDDPGTRQVVSRFLREVGYSVTGAATAAEAYAAGAARPPAAVVSDWSLGDGSTGADVATCVRRIDPAVPIVLVSAMPLPALCHRGGVVAAAAVLPKPLRLSDLLLVLNEIADHRRGARPGPSPAVRR